MIIIIIIRRSMMLTREASALCRSHSAAVMTKIIFMEPKSSCKCESLFEVNYSRLYMQCDWFTVWETYAIDWSKQRVKVIAVRLWLKIESEKKHIRKKAERERERDISTSGALLFLRQWTIIKLIQFLGNNSFVSQENWTSILLFEGKSEFNE